MPVLRAGPISTCWIADTAVLPVIFIAATDLARSRWWFAIRSPSTP